MKRLRGGQAGAGRVDGRIDTPQTEWIMLVLWNSTARLPTRSIIRRHQQLDGSRPREHICIAAVPVDYFKKNTGQWRACLPAPSNLPRGTWVHARTPARPVPLPSEASLSVRLPVRFVGGSRACRCQARRQGKAARWDGTGHLPTFLSPPAANSENDDAFRFLDSFPWRRRRKRSAGIRPSWNPESGGSDHRRKRKGSGTAGSGLGGF